PANLRTANGAAGVAAHELPRRGRGSDSLLHRLLDPRLTEGPRVLSLWRQSDAVLGFRGGVHARSHAGHLGSVGPGSQGGRRRISRTASSDGDPRGGRVTALLLSAPDRVVVPAARLTPDRFESPLEGVSSEGRHGASRVAHTPIAPVVQRGTSGCLIGCD